MKAITACEIGTFWIQPQATFGGHHLHTFPFEMTAAYMFHIVQNHLFVDGNKRTGVVAALAFLDLNDIVIDAPKDALYVLTLNVATGKAGKADIAEFFRSHAHGILASRLIRSAFRPVNFSQRSTITSQ